MSENITVRLRRKTRVKEGGRELDPECQEAADTIDSLRAQVASLTERHRLAEERFEERNAWGESNLKLAEDYKGSRNYWRERAEGFERERDEAHEERRVWEARCNDLLLNNERLRIERDEAQTLSATLQNDLNQIWYPAIERLTKELDEARRALDAEPSNEALLEGARALRDTFRQANQIERARQVYSAIRRALAQQGEGR